MQHGRGIIICCFILVVGLGTGLLVLYVCFFLSHVPRFRGDERVVGDAPSSSGDARSTFCRQAHDAYTSFLSYILRANMICCAGSSFLTLSRLYPSTNRPRTTPSSPSSSPLPQSSSPHASAPFTTAATRASLAVYSACMAVTTMWGLELLLLRFGLGFKVRHPFSVLFSR